MVPQVLVRWREGRRGEGRAGLEPEVSWWIQTEYCLQYLHLHTNGQTQTPQMQPRIARDQTDEGVRNIGDEQARVPLAAALEVFQSLQTAQRQKLKQ